MRHHGSEIRNLRSSNMCINILPGVRKVAVEQASGILELFIGREFASGYQRSINAKRKADLDTD